MFYVKRKYYIHRQIYENAKRKDSSRMEAQIIRYENAKDKKL